MNVSRLLKCLGGLIVAAGVLLAQPETLRVEATLVLVPAMVRDRSGQPVYSLKAEDFELTDDGELVPLTLDEDMDTRPLALVIAVETGGAGARRLGYLRGVGSALAALVGGAPRQVAIVSFDSQPQLALGFTDNLDTVTEKLAALPAGDGGAAIVDALRVSAGQLRKQPGNVRRVILLFSETIDRSSQTGVDAAMRAISDANAVVYSLSYSSVRSRAGHEAAKISQPHTPAPAGGCMAKQNNESGSRALQAYDCLSVLAPPLRLANAAAMAAMDLLRRNTAGYLARLSGGEALPAGSERELVEQIIGLSNRLPNIHMLSFHPQSPHVGYHELTVRLPRHPKLRVESRNGYWVEDAAARR
jgi:VWFA-related protein